VIATGQFMDMLDKLEAKQEAMAKKAYGVDDVRFIMEAEGYKMALNDMFEELEKQL